MRDHKSSEKMSNGQPRRHRKEEKSDSLTTMNRKTGGLTDKEKPFN